MSELPRSWRWTALVVVVLLGVVALIAVMARNGGSRSTVLSSSAPASFRESAREAGITFRMSFLPGEQGENFKINLYDHGCGVAIGDYDGDGCDDIYFTNQLGANALYRNKGDGTFEDVSKKAGVALGDRVCVAATFADYDNDGKPDLFVTSTRGGNVLFHNRGDGTFTDVSKQAGVNLVAHSQTAVFFDYDNDGWLDLFVTNTAKWTTSEVDPVSKYYLGPVDFWQLAASPIEHNVLYHNNQDGTFSEVTAKSGLQGMGWGGDVAVFDYNEDGKLDLFVTNMFGASQLYRNKGDGTFTEVTRDTLGRTTWGAIGSKAFDFNNDGKLDLFIVDMHSDMWQYPPNSPEMMELVKANEKKKHPYVMGPFLSNPGLRSAAAVSKEKLFAEQFHIRYEEVIFGNTLFKNLGGGKFAEVSDKANMETFWPWGVATGDFDNDGYEDVYLPSGMGYPFFYWPSYLMMNNGDETFTDRARAAGVEPPPGGEYLDKPIGGKPAARSGRCAAVADFDGDGQLDLIANNFNDHPYYFRNHFPSKNWIAFRLRGSKSNRDAIGTVVTLHADSGTMVRQVQGAGGYLSQSSKTVHFGVGARMKVDWVEIVWPSGIRQRLDNPALNRRHDVTEAEK
jgi:hypothetical protein